jgi:hypothetical protein
MGTETPDQWYLTNRKQWQSLDSTCVQVVCRRNVTCRLKSSQLNIMPAAVVNNNVLYHVQN